MGQCSGCRRMAELEEDSFLTCLGDTHILTSSLPPFIATETTARVCGAQAAAPSDHGPTSCRARKDRLSPWFGLTFREEHVRKRAEVDRFKSSFPSE